jgi:tetratricopeptide (TPR) repeat protein
MPKRPREHVLEEESRKAFENVIPSEWTIQKQEPDYGIDLQVNIFENAQATSQLFYVQLKATDSVKTLTETPRFTFKTERLLYYQTLPYPMMLVLYDATGKRIFYEWLHDYLESLSTKDTDRLTIQKNLSVSFKQQIVEFPTEIIKRSVKHYMNRTIGTRANGSEFRVKIENLSRSPFIDTVKTYFSESLDSNPSTQFIKMDGKQLEDSLIKIEMIESDKVSLSNEVVSLKVDLDSKQEHENVSLMSNYLNILTAFAFVKCGRASDAVDQISNYILSNKPIYDGMYELLISELVILLYTANKRQAECLEIAQFLQEKGQHNLAMSFASIARMTSTNHAYYSQKYRLFITRSLESESNQIVKATKHYNIANSYRADRMNRESLLHYIIAARLHPKYLQKSYWWAEVGGSLFEIGKLRWAEIAYRKAIELGETHIHVVALLGDSLFFQGKFQEAQEVLSRYVKGQPRPFADAIIKLQLIDVYLENFDAKPRNAALSKELLSSQEGLDQPNLEVINEAIALNPLSPEGWHKLAISSDEPMAAVWTAVTSKSDISEWSWAIMSTLQLIKSQNGWLGLLTAAVSAEANRLFGKSIQKRIHEILKTIPFPPEDIDLYLEQIEFLMNSSRYLFFSEYNPKIELRAIFDD